MYPIADTSEFVSENHFAALLVFVWFKDTHSSQAATSSFLQLRGFCMIEDVQKSELPTLLQFIRVGAPNQPHVHLPMLRAPPPVLLKAFFFRLPFCIKDTTHVHNSSSSLSESTNLMRNWGLDAKVSMKLRQPPAVESAIQDELKCCSCQL